MANEGQEYEVVSPWGTGGVGALTALKLFGGPAILGGGLMGTIPGAVAAGKNRRLRGALLGALAGSGTALAATAGAGAGIGTLGGLAHNAILREQNTQ